MCESNNKTRINASRGFTLVEVVIVIGIIGILAAVGLPVMSTFTKKAEYRSLMATLDQLLDAEDSYYIVNNTFYPENFGIINRNSGEAVDIPGLGFNFQTNQKHRYRILSFNQTIGNIKFNICYTYVWADADYNGDGMNDYFIVMSQFRNGEPLTVGSVTYNRYFQQIW
jgi:prepilin-type N-terminal cleavage/methylation domain-containing protein